MKKLIYAADDEEDILEVIKGFLENADFSVSTFSTGDALYKAFLETPCDLAVLDIMMPGSDGLTICKELRKISDVPIVILTAKESETDHMRGFMLGGDDYLIKPFSPSLLVVRIQALLRRVEMSSTSHSSLKFGDITYSEYEHDALCNGKSIGLTMTEFSLLGCLMQNAGTAVSRNDLLDNVWGINNNDIETRVTDETVRRIRKKMRDAGSRVKITAVWGYGYKLEDGNE
jgi:DNA-binding response OmpR family regulator